MQGPLSIDEQIADMAATWPQFAVIGREKTTASFEGKLRPIFQTFAVRILYRAPLVVEQFDPRKMQPRVKIIDPPLRPRRGDPEGELPHVYYVGSGSLDVVLCMFDPEGHEWSPSMRLAETTVPWTIDWLASYEGWRATGEWVGGGRHPAVATLPEVSS